MTRPTAQGLDDSTVFQRERGVQHAAIADGTLVYVAATRHVHELNDTAALVWGQITGHRTLGDIVDVVARGGGRPSATVRDGVVAFIADLLAAGAIREAVGPEPADARSVDASATDTDITPSAGQRSTSPTSWTGTGYRALDHHFSVATSDNDLGEYLRHVLAGLVSTDLPGTLTHYSIDTTTQRPDVWADGERIGSPNDRAGVTDLLLWHVQRSAAASIRSGLALHAGVVVHQGRALLLPGAPDAGKSTLVAGLCLAGFGYFSDEIAHVQRGRVRAFRKPVGLDSGSWTVLPHLDPTAERPDWAAFVRSRWNVAPARLSGPPPTATMPSEASIATIVAPTYVAGRATHVEPLDRGDTITLLMNQALGVGSTDGLQTAVTLAENIAAFRLSYSDLDDAVAAVRRHLETVRPAS